ncbi:hypothetical protein BACSTE_00348 [Bacteroides stercoris ATCC 43183]|uniref:Uncharacterized protein n=1 Tax=Bacteroides stercoris ATCC 43183 TaxID=449673 RepID=B0NLL9_BACSE|nr:hypothetical protein BACSTE_00348 [Bacteroides stercoris ATCC 43183]
MSLGQLIKGICEGLEDYMITTEYLQKTILMKYIAALHHLPLMW